MSSPSSLMRDKLRLSTIGRTKEGPSPPPPSSSPSVRKQRRRSILPKKSSLEQIINEGDDDGDGDNVATSPLENDDTVLFAGRQKRGCNHRHRHFYTSFRSSDIDESGLPSGLANNKSMHGEDGRWRRRGRSEGGDSIVLVNLPDEGSLSRRKRDA
mmetsp:Transcript_19160/g.40133  ORF Transcript_19160/g.40133 Transcript_19160/m.40133 type:complete len:156 (+) Transcript_19160:2428-2895(+)